jgi:hypothetical protein
VEGGRLKSDDVGLVGGECVCVWCVLWVEGCVGVRVVALGGSLREVGWVVQGGRGGWWGRVCERGGPEGLEEERIWVPCRLGRGRRSREWGPRLCSARRGLEWACMT